MHDPQTVAHEIFLGAKEKKNGHYKTPLITIWHKDPEKDGSDDSCGWFIRSRHIDPILVDKVKKEFAFNFKHNYWFNSLGLPKLSTIGTVINMYNTAAWQVFIYQNNGKPDRKKHDRFMRKHLFDFIFFAENPSDSLNDQINLNYGPEKEEERISHFTSIILADIMRKLRPWYKHPRWHINHWRLTFPLFRSWYRLYIERCDRCNQRLRNNSVYTDWNGTEHWCEKCNGSSPCINTTP